MLYHISGPFKNPIPPVLRARRLDVQRGHSQPPGDRHAQELRFHDRARTVIRLSMQPCIGPRHSHELQVSLQIPAQGLGQRLMRKSPPVPEGDHQRLGQAGAQLLQCITDGGLLQVRGASLLFFSTPGLILTSFDQSFLRRRWKRRSGRLLWATRQTG